MRNRKHTEETKRKISLSLKGKKPSTETREKMSKSGKGRIFSEEHKAKIGLANKGQKTSEETKRILSKINKGKKLSEETKKKMSLSQTGEKNSRWAGGISFEKYTIDWTETLKDSIRQRDNYICQECGLHQNELTGRFKKLDVHHIDYNKQNCNPDNLITLCRVCHMKTNSNRDYWLTYFNQNDYITQRTEGDSEQPEEV